MAVSCGWEGDHGKKDMWPVVRGPAHAGVQDPQPGLDLNLLERLSHSPGKLSVLTPAPGWPPEKGLDPRAASCNTFCLECSSLSLGREQDPGPLGPGVPLGYQADPCVCVKAAVRHLSYFHLHGSHSENVSHQLHGDSQAPALSAFAPNSPGH